MHSSRVVESEGEFSVSALALREQLSLHSKRKVSRALGLGLAGLTVAFLAADAVGKLLAPELMVATTPSINLPADPSFYRLLGAILALCTVLYIFPRTAVLGAVLLTGYLGGAVAVHLRAESLLLSSPLFGVYVGAFAWSGLWLREPRLRALLPLRD
jgi:hypothetical protein